MRALPMPERALLTDDEEQSKRVDFPYAAGERAFDEIVVDAINETLTIFGESFRQVVLFHIEKQSGLSEGQLPNRLERFHHALFTIFGSGARKLELEILKKLFRKLGTSFNSSRSFEFIKEVERARKLATLNEHAL